MPEFDDWLKDAGCFTRGNPSIPAESYKKFIADTISMDAEAGRHYQIPAEILEDISKRSCVQWRALLCLAIIWHRTEMKMVSSKKLKKSTYQFATNKKNEPNIKSRYWLPKLSFSDLHSICFPYWIEETRSTRRQAKLALEKLEKKGAISIILKEKNQWQIGRPFSFPWVKE